MSNFEKLVLKVLAGSNISYADAERIVLCLDFELDMSGSHHIFRKKGYKKTISIKRRPKLLPYQVKQLQNVLEDHNYHGL